MAFKRSRGLRILLAAGWLLFLAGLGGSAAFYLYFVRDLPDLRGVEDYRPPLASHVYDREGRLAGEFFAERRRLTPLERVPDHVVHAFVAGEDSSFFQHSGIDYQSILRAAWVNLRAGGEIRQGGSTITQQMVKGLLLSPERRYRRKIREMILARRIEQRFTKDEILFLYLNQIYFGGGAYGVGEAARTYFGKDVADLSVSEGALLAGLPKAPSRYSPFASLEESEQRRHYVLSRMYEDRFIDEPTYRAALAETPALADPEPDPAVVAAAYFVEEVRRRLFDELGGDLVLRGGLRIETTLDLPLQRAGVRALRQGLVDLDHRQGYRGHVRRVPRAEVAGEIERLEVENGIAPAPAEGEEPPAPRELLPERAYLGVVTAVDKDAQQASVAFAPGLGGRVRLDDVSWARPEDPEARPYQLRSIDALFRVGDVAHFQLGATPAGEAGGEGEPWVGLHQQPIVQGALLSLEVGSGDVIALVGGYDFEKSQFNRVTQAIRQPGSSFKPFIYGAALSRGYTPASIVYDRPVVYVDESSGFTWRPRNYGRKFYGPMTLREALARSVNNATVHLFRDVGVDYVIDYAQRVGIESPLNRDLSLALGSSGVTLLELTRGYAVFPAAGRRVEPRFILRVTDRDGNVLLEDLRLGEAPQAAPPEGDGEPEPGAADGEPLVAEAAFESEAPGDAAAPLPPGRVLEAEQAYLVTDLLRAVVEDPRGTGWRLRALRRPLAGKTGTTNDQADAWFMGFSPDVMTGVWVGHDESRFLGWGETGSRAAAPVWVEFMRAALAGRPVRDFTIPDEIVFARVDRKTGLLADAYSEDTVFQAFIAGSEPTRTARLEREQVQAEDQIFRDAF